MALFSSSPSIPGRVSQSYFSYRLRPTQAFFFLRKFSSVRTTFSLSKIHSTAFSAPSSSSSFSSPSSRLLGVQRTSRLLQTNTLLLSHRGRHSALRSFIPSTQLPSHPSSVSPYNYSVKNTPHHPRSPTSQGDLSFNRTSSEAASSVYSFLTPQIEGKRFLHTGCVLLSLPHKRSHGTPVISLGTAPSVSQYAATRQGGKISSLLSNLQQTRAWSTESGEASAPDSSTSSSSSSSKSTDPWQRQTRPIKKLLVANRGEIAVRVHRACKELGITSVGIYSQEDSQALHRQVFDECYLVGKGLSPVGAYLNYPNIIEIAQRHNVDAIHPGYGFLSENSEFAAAVERAGIMLVGPPPEVIQRMGDKVEARKAADMAKVQSVPGTNSPVNTYEEAEEVCRDIGFPVMLKAAYGGGGRGMRRVFQH
ncbi:pyruvate carboxylase, partial [Cystoisospora suis]